MSELDILHFQRLFLKNLKAIFDISRTKVAVVAITAIPVNIGYNFFVTRIDELIMQMEQGAQKVLDTPK